MHVFPVGEKRVECRDTVEVSKQFPLQVDHFPVFVDAVNVLRLAHGFVSVCLFVNLFDCILTCCNLILKQIIYCLSVNVDIVGSVTRLLNIFNYSFEAFIVF